VHFKIWRKPDFEPITAS